MKRTLSFMVMALALLLTQCRKPEVKFPSPVAPEGTTVSMTVTAGPGGKTDISETGAITWSTGDKLYVGDGAKYIGCLTLQGAGGSATGTFSGDVTLTGISEGTEKEFGFFYLGRDNGVEPSLNATTVEVSFATQEIYADANNKLENASKHHVGYGSAKGTVSGGIVTGINVTMVSKVALARFSFTEAAGKGAYTGPLTLSGTGIYNKMTVDFASGTGFSFSGTEGAIRLRGSYSERYVMLVPVGTGSKTLNFDGGASGTAALENGIESNKFYGRDVAIGVEVTPQEYVDLGLTVKWATCNLGASKPEEYGDYYAWGETETKSDYGWDTYKWCNGSYTTLTKYNTKSSYGTVDNKTTLEFSDDAARANWGGGWRMPTEAEFTELINNTTRTWKAAGASITIGGQTVSMPVAGYYCVSTKTGHTGKYIFLPAAGYHIGSSLYNEGKYCEYWSSSLDKITPYYGKYLFVYYYPLECYVNETARSGGGSVRPVFQPQN